MKKPLLWGGEGAESTEELEDTRWEGFGDE